MRHIPIFLLIITSSSALAVLSCTSPVRDTVAATPDSSNTTPVYIPPTPTCTVRISFPKIDSLEEDSL